MRWTVASALLRPIAPVILGARVKPSGTGPSVGQARRNGPFRIPSMLPMEIGTPNNGGAVVTAGGHHFMETPIGDEVIAYALP